jgi:acetolactate synthase-1/2/3 large subunit
LRTLIERLRLPVFVNGLGRGCIAADHELYLSRARSEALGAADLVLLVGAPLDFRLGFGSAFADDAQVVVIAPAEPRHDPLRAVDVELYGALPATLADLARAVAVPSEGLLQERLRWLGRLRGLEHSLREQEAAAAQDPRSPLHPARVYAELRDLLGRDTIIVCDGGDFVSFAGRLLDSFEPGCWLDPGPYGCLGSGPGYALAAKLAHPERQVVMLQGDGAFGFAAMDFETLARHGVAVISVLGNNGIWGLEKHPMEAIYGYSMAADLQPELRYDAVVEALGCHGELVRAPGELRGAFERSLASGKPALINVLTDPTVVYPRRSNLA